MANGSILPNGYVKLKYLIKTGIAYIDTTIDQKDTIGVQLQAKFDTYGSNYQYLIGAYQASDYFGIWKENANTINFCHKSYIFNVTNSDTDNFHTLSLNFLNDRRAKFDGTELGVISETKSAITPSLYVGDTNYGSTHFDGDFCIGIVQITDETDLVANLIPCQRENDNAVGFYDLVSDQFLGQTGGSGSFTVGPIDPITELNTIKQIQLAGIVYDLQVDSVNNCNPDAIDTNKFDWIGTQAEYISQNVAVNHPNWVCFITDDISDQTGIIDLSNYVKKTGNEEIGGDKTFTNHRIKIKSNTAYNQTPATQEFTSVFFDDGTTNWGAAEVVKGTDGSNCVQINVMGQNGSWTDCPLGIGVTAAGNTYTYAPTPSAISNNNAIATTSYITTILSTLYPVGSLYLGTQSTCPLATLIPGSTWTQIQGRYLLASGTLSDTTETAAAGTYISAGLPNITGSFIRTAWARGGSGAANTVSGAFTASGNGNCSCDGGDGGANSYGTVNFSAQNSNSIYGQSATVRPAAYTINVWQRTT